MQLNPIIDSFYRNKLDYAGLHVDEHGAVTNATAGKQLKNKAGKHYYLPYISQQQNPEGKTFFHLLNENTLRPESESFNIFKNNVMVNLNVKLSKLLALLVDVGSDPLKQSLLKKSSNVKLITGLGVLDESQLKLIQNLFKSAVEKDGLEPFFSIFIRKNGKYKGETYAALGKINFSLYNEATTALETGEYKMYGRTVRKKDAEAIANIMRALFPGIGDVENYSEVSNSNLFKYLDVFLRTSYLVAHRINVVIEDLAKDLTDDEGAAPLLSNLLWAEELPKLYEMEAEIRIIPNQDNVQDEANLVRMPPTQKTHTPQQPAVQPGFNSFNPNMVPTQQPAPMQQPMQPQAPQSSGNPLEDIVYGKMPHPAQMQTWQQNQAQAMQAMAQNPMAMAGQYPNMGMAPMMGSQPMMAGGYYQQPAYNPYGGTQGYQPQMQQPMQQGYGNANPQAMGMPNWLQQQEQIRVARENGMLAGNNMAYNQTKHHTPSAFVPAGSPYARQQLTATMPGGYGGY